MSQRQPLRKSGAGARVSGAFWQTARLVGFSGFGPRPGGWARRLGAGDAGRDGALAGLLLLGMASGFGEGSAGCWPVRHGRRAPPGIVLGCRPAARRGAWARGPSPIAGRKTCRAGDAGAHHGAAPNDGLVCQIEYAPIRTARPERQGWPRWASRNRGAGWWIGALIGGRGGGRGFGRVGPCHGGPFRMVRWRPPSPWERARWRTGNRIIDRR